MNNQITITKSDGKTELFDEQKLIISLTRAGASPDAVSDVVEEVEKEMKDGMSTADIYRRAFELLRKHSLPSAIKYSIRRAILELGPDGFPFEKFVARIFKMWGYETLTDQVLLGTCVDHEVDVVAWKDNDLAMVEAKYHNEFGMKSDLKVALYVKARYDDLSQTDFDFGGKKRRLGTRWLATNTKFTDKAIKYSECNNVKLLGWNHPFKGNLHELITENGLHPISCIGSLTRDQKKDLVGRNVLACIDIIARPAILSEIGVKGLDAEKVLTEAQIIIEKAK